MCGADTDTAVATAFDLVFEAVRSHSLSSLADVLVRNLERPPLGWGNTQISLPLCL